MDIFCRADRNEVKNLEKRSKNVQISKINNSTFAIDINALVSIEIANLILEYKRSVQLLFKIEAFENDIK